MLHIYKDTVRLPNGKTSTREYTVHHGAVCILPLLENGDVLRLAQEASNIWSVIFRSVPLLLLLAAIFIRHAGILKKRNEAFTQEDRSAAAACLFTDCASLLAALGLKRGTGSMLELCETAKEQLGEEYAAKLHDMTMYNAQALFSSRAISPEQLTEMRAFHGTTMENLKTRCKPLRKLRLKWLNCLY